LYWVCLSVFSCTVLFVSISQVIGCEDRLRNDLYCVEWGVKLQPTNRGTAYSICVLTDEAIMQHNTLLLLQHLLPCGLCLCYIIGLLVVCFLIFGLSLFWCRHDCLVPRIHFCDFYYDVIIMFRIVIYHKDLYLKIGNVENNAIKNWSNLTKH